MGESETCTAAFFRSCGKDVATEKEFVMKTTLTLHWIANKDAAGLLKVLVSDGCVTVKDGYVRPAIDISSVKVPFTYKPSDELRARAENIGKAPPEPEDAFSLMVSMLPGIGMERPAFMSACRRISRELGITQTAAGVIVLRDAGADVGRLYSKVRAEIRSL